MPATEFERKRVFLDLDSLTQWDHHITLRYPQATKVPIYGLEPGPAGSWDEAATTIWGSVIKEGSLFRMWYWGLRAPKSYNEQTDLPMTCYAESDDGIHWRKPDLRITGQNRFPGNNLLTLPGAMMSVVPALPGTDTKYLAVTIMYAIPLEPDVQDIPGAGVPDPLKGGGGTHIWASDDGLHWRHLSHVMTHGDWACLYPDTVNKRYILHNKCGAAVGLTSRRIAIGVESKDGKKWEGYGGVRKWRETFVADDFDDLIAQQRGFLLAETYGVGIYRAGEILVSIESMLNVSPPLREIMGQNPAGLCHVRLGFSRDGFLWRYPKGRPAFMELGAPGTEDAGFIVPASTLVEHGDDLYFYYGGSRYDHDWSINPDFSINRDIPLSEHRNQCRVMMAKIGRDRFASLAAVWKGRFDVDAGYRYGQELHVNTQASNGEVRVALAEKSDHYHAALRKHESLPGYSFDDCIPITGDVFRAPVRFRNAKVGDIPADRPLTVRFELSRAEVYSYEWV